MVWEIERNGRALADGESMLSIHVLLYMKEVKERIKKRISFCSYSTHSLCCSLCLRHVASKENQAPYFEKCVFS